MEPVEEDVELEEIDALDECTPPPKVERVFVSRSHPVATSSAASSRPKARETSADKSAKRRKEVRRVQSAALSSAESGEVHAVDDRHIFGSHIDSRPLEEDSDATFEEESAKVLSSGSSHLSSLLGADSAYAPLPFSGAFDTREMLQTPRGHFCTYFACAKKKTPAVSSSAPVTASASIPMGKSISMTMPMGMSAARPISTPLTSTSATVTCSAMVDSTLSTGTVSEEVLDDSLSDLEDGVEMTAVTPHTDGDTLTFVCLHGAGHCGLSWAMVASLLKPQYNVLAFDYRAHGDTVIDDASEEYNLSKDSLVEDIIAVIEAKFLKGNPPPIVLVGHSLGGALAIHCAHIAKKSGRLPSLMGIVVIDVVEGTALGSLVHMKSIIHSRPRSFLTLQHAIKYCYTSGMIRNSHSARVSTPRMFVEAADGSGRVLWRTDLMKSAPFWRGWFLGMSKLFLGSPGAKLLVLADTDRLDKTLTIGQMQGRYQLQIMGMGVGHTAHEDSPKRVADYLRAFATRNQFERMWKLNRKFALKKKKPK